tara:strand:- start:205 stop:591 length:387 start_codon:yes stop_codon:yes gene_type:complete
MKACGRCKIDKALEEFPRAKSNSEKRRSYCRVCAAEQMRVWRNKNPDTYLKSRYKRTYKITDTQYNKLKKIQECEICNKKTALHLDHNHKTGDYRGMLCINCNTALGGFKDNIKLLNNAIKYLNNDGV